MSVDSGYHLVLASSVGERDGMALELTRDVDGKRVAEVFEDGDTGLRSFAVFVFEPLPLELLRWFIESVDERL